MSQSEEQVDVDGTPNWFYESSEEKLEGPCLKITIEREEDLHSGYCSDGEEFEVRKQTLVVYVPKEPNIKEWKADTGHCICCSACARYKVVKIEQG